MHIPFAEADFSELDPMEQQIPKQKFSSYPRLLKSPDERESKSYAARVPDPPCKGNLNTSKVEDSRDSPQSPFHPNERITSSSGGGSPTKRSKQGSVSYDEMYSSPHSPDSEESSDLETASLEGQYLSSMTPKTIMGPEEATCDYGKSCPHFFCPPSEGGQHSAQHVTMQNPTQRCKSLRDILHHIDHINKSDDQRLDKCVEFRSDDFETIRVIGTGSFGTVTASLHTPTKKYYAIKYMDKSSLAEQESYLDDLFNEISLLVSFQDSNFLNCCYGFVQTVKVFGIVMELQCGGELFTILPDEYRFPQSCKIFVAAEILAGLEELHSREIMYRDLKAENVILAADGHMVLTDFGYSKYLPKNGRTLTLVGTPDYTAPEMIRRETYGYKADIWSYGVLLFEIFCLMPPFNLHEATTKTEKYTRILKCHLSFPCGLPSSFVKLVSGILQTDPDKRLGIQQIKSHAFFKDIDWNIVSNRKLPPSCLPPVKIDMNDITKNFENFDLDSQDDVFADF